jgi:pyridoxal phosphate enzyme (YggS family)
MQEIAQNINAIRSRIRQIQEKLGREAEQITLVAVTKTHPTESVDIALENGILHIGENKVQEAMRKLPMLKNKYEGFHFIGHLQSNKINQLLSLKTYLIQSIDSLYLAEKLHKALGRTNRTQDILVQVNTTNEEQKSGVNTENAEEMIWKIASYSSLRVRGLMTIGKLHPDPEISRPYFQHLKALFDKLAPDLPEGFDFLSMGMSHDWEIALQEGSNMLRIGSAIFGERHYGEDR